MRKMSVLAVVLGLVAATHATTLYSTGFEPPMFVAGSSLIGQDGWQGDSEAAAQVQTAVVYAGTQAASFDSSPVVSAWWWKVTPFDPVGAGEPIVEISAQMQLGSAGTPSGSWGFDVYDSTVARSALLYVDSTNLVKIYDVEGATALDTGISVTRDTWFSVKLVLDYANDTYYGVVNGVPTLTTNLGSQLDLSDADVRVTGAQYDMCYVDEFSITATPEPASCLLLGLGILALRRR
jgi:hypothetical protein